MSVLLRNGWKICFYTAFQETYDDLMAVAESVKATKPESFSTHPKVKVLKRIQQIIFNEIPINSADARYNLGNALGADNRYWRRAKFLQRYRLFFRYHGAHKIIVYAWVNDEKTPRKAGSRKDPYALFQKRLQNNDPPGNWDELVTLSRPVP